MVSRNELDVAGVQALLESLNLGQYAEQFAQHRVDGAALAEVRDESDLAQLGMDVAVHQRKLLAECRRRRLSGRDRKARRKGFFGRAKGLLLRGGGCPKESTPRTPQLDRDATTEASPRPSSPSGVVVQPTTTTTPPRNTTTTAVQQPSIAPQSTPASSSSDAVAPQVQKIAAGKYNLFLSYRVHPDKEFVEKLYHRLTEAGFEVFWDKERLETGKAWDEGFAEGLANSTMFVPIMTRKALAPLADLEKGSPCDNVLLEYTLAQDHMQSDTATSPLRYIVPLMTDNSDPKTTQTLTQFRLKGDNKSAPDCPSIVVDAVHRARQKHLARTDMSPMTVADTWDGILKYQGVFLIGDPDHCLDTAVATITERLLRISHIQDAVVKEVHADPIVNQGLSLYVPLDATETREQAMQGTPPTPLLERLNPFIRSNVDFGDPTAPRLLLLQGDAGAGKSLSLRHLEQESHVHTDKQRAAMNGEQLRAALGNAAKTPLGDLVEMDAEQLREALLHAESGAPLAIFVSLPRHLDALQSKDDVIAAAFRETGLDAPAIDAWRRSSRLVVLLDGFDEVQGLEHGNVHDAFRLTTDWPRCKVIVGCRSGYLPEDEEAVFKLFLRAPLLQPTVTRVQRRKALPQAFLVPFSPTRRDKYIRKFAESEWNEDGGLWDAAKYDKHLNTVFSDKTLQSLLDTPFTLSLVLKILPTLVGDQNRHCHGKNYGHRLGRCEVYAAFVKHWFEREFERKRHEYEGNTAAAYSKEDLLSFYLEYAQELALEMFKQEVQIAPLPQNVTRKRTKAEEERRQKALQRHQRLGTGTAGPTDLWRRFVPSGNESKQDVTARVGLAMSPLRKVGENRYQFLHKSFQEFFAAMALKTKLCEGTNKETRKAAVDALSAHFIAPDDLVVDFLADLIRTQRWLRTCCLTNCLQPENATDVQHIVDFVRDLEFQGFERDYEWWREGDDKSVVADFEEMAIHRKEFWIEKHLLDLVLASKSTPASVAVGSGMGPSAKAASNAMTILNASAFNFYGMDLSGVRIPGARLSHVSMPHVNLSGSDLTGVVFKSALLNGSKLTGATLKDVEFGELAFLEGHLSNVMSVAFSPHDASLVLTGSWDKTARVWNLKTGQQVGAPMEGHSSGVTSVAFSPHDASLVLTGSDDKTARVWNHVGGVMSIVTGGQSRSLDLRGLVWDDDADPADNPNNTSAMTRALIRQRCR